jgi:hypothetical protein
MHHGVYSFEVWATITLDLANTVGFCERKAQPDALYTRFVLVVAGSG